MKRLIGGALVTALILGVESRGSAQVRSTVAVPMHPRDGAGQNGTAVLHEVGPNVVVTISERKKDVSHQSAHVYAGTCENLDPARTYHLADVTNGGSRTTLKRVTLFSLEVGRYAVAIHKTGDPLRAYSSCGEIPNEVIIIP